MNNFYAPDGGCMRTVVRLMLMPGNPADKYLCNATRRA